MTTIKEIAQKSGFSTATVSRLLNGDPKLSVAAETKSKILRAANELGYWKKLQKSASPKPAVALLYRVNGKEHLQDEYFAFLKQAVETVAKDKADLTVFTDINELISQAELYQGFLGVGTAELSRQNLEQLHQVLPNGVFIDINPAPAIFDSVQPNLSLAIEDAVDRLLKAGIDDFAFVGAESFNLDHVPQRDIREITFDEYTKAKKVKRALIFSDGIVSADNGYHLGKEILHKCGKNLPRALIIASDTLSVGVLQAFNEAEIKVPDQVAIISINNSDIAKYVAPPLSSYNIDQAQLSKLAVDLLLNKLVESNRPNVHLTLNANLVLRKSFR